MTNQNRQYWSIWRDAVLIAIGIVLICFICSSCKLFREVKASSEDNTSLKKDTETSLKVDTSKSRSESAYTKETFFFPGRDTTINNYIFQPAQTPAPTVYIRETGSKKEETNNFRIEDLKKELLDSISASKQVKETETKVKVGFTTFEIIVLAALGLFVLKSFGPSILNVLTKK